MKNLFTCLGLCLLLAACHSPGKEESSNNLGELQHEFDIDGPAREAFDRGLLLLHSFEYEDAREAFQEAREAAPDEMMACWGEAMTHYRALWGLQDVEAGRKVMEQAGPTEEERLARANGALEKGFWQGLEILYGEGEFHDRNRAYAEHMALLHDEYPENQEIAAFYALGLMWSNTISRDDELYNLSARVAEGILEENPNHPGALHYMIHAYDDPDYAERAERAADLYAEVAPDATHALHMPSHIYVALGMWNEVVVSNEDSYAASVNRMEKKGLDDAARGYHSYAWLHYGYLQQGRFTDAARLLHDMYTFTESADTDGARYYLIMMQNHYLSETGSLPDDRVMDVNYTSLDLGSKAGMHFLKARIAVKSKDAARIDAETDTLETYIAAAELVVTDDGVSLCSVGPTRYAPNKDDILRAKVVAEQMKAMKASVENNREREEYHLSRAVALQDELGPPIGPPAIYTPAYEHYGYWLLDHDRPEEALKLFDRGLRKMPNRRMALEGKQQALRALGQDREAEEIEKLLLTFVRPDEIS